MALAGSGSAPRRGGEYECVENIIEA